MQREDKQLPMKNDRARQAERVSWVGLGANAFLALLKLSAGFAGNSAAMIADGVNSLSDLGTDIVAVVSFRITGRPIDRSHGYGHGKFETLATAIIGSALLAVAVGIFFGGGERILTVLRGGTLPRPGLVALAAAAVSILIKETLLSSPGGRPFPLQRCAYGQGMGSPIGCPRIDGCHGRYRRCHFSGSKSKGP